MMKIEREVDRVLLLLRNKIRERGFTQSEVQNRLNWGRSYISQILTKQKALRLEQVLLILDVIEIDPEEFFGELYSKGYGSSGYHRDVRGPFFGLFEGTRSPLSELSRSVKELRFMLRGLVGLLVDRQVIGMDDLATAVRATDQGNA